MPRRTTWFDTDSNGIEYTLAFESVGDVQTARIGDRLVIAYLSLDYDPINPMKNWDGQGVLHTKNAEKYLGLAELSSGRNDFVPEFDIEGVEKRLEAFLREHIPQTDLIRMMLESGDDAETVFQNIFSEWSGGSPYYRSDYEWSDNDLTMFDTLPNFEAAQLKAWEDAYLAGEVGDYLAVPVWYCESCHGPGTARIYTTDLDNANAVWVPDNDCIENMDFSGCTTYLQRLAVADKYAASVLNEYENWCNSEVYGCVTQTYQLDNNQWVEESEDDCWGFIGSDYAKEVLISDFFKPAIERALKENAINHGGTQCELY